MRVEQKKYMSEERSLNEALQHGISLEESKRRLEDVIYSSLYID